MNRDTIAGGFVPAIVSWLHESTGYSMKALDTPLQYVLDHSSFSIGSKAKKAPETPPCQMKLRVALAHWFHVVVMTEGE